MASSSPANSAIDICSRALILVGAEPITSFDDDTTEALIAGNMYEDIARTNLTSTRWRFSTNQAVLNRLTDAPTGRFEAAYQLPEYLFVHAVTVRDLQIEYNIYGNKIFCDASPTDELIVDFTYRASEVDWPSYFSICVEYAMATVFATALIRDQSLAVLMDQQYVRFLAKARSIDSQQQTTRKVTTSRFITNRRS
ncbi:MAG: hypothetical protein Tp167SUR398091_8 [Prokaryotic dsDNA virus sp.]|nr:MAG: hypothetical protein Tp167SUR398091_8 [Prokaryotic dsDNA virus sp.]|tara:strand:+ start:5424 stop:6011 length:588 start_codon:yes stop_codon:yes gene_type:complete